MCFGYIAKWAYINGVPIWKLAGNGDEMNQTEKIIRGYLDSLPVPLPDELAQMFRRTITPVLDRWEGISPDQTVQVIDWAMSKVFSHVAGKKVKFLLGYPLKDEAK